MEEQILNIAGGKLTPLDIEKPYFIVNLGSVHPSGIYRVVSVMKKWVDKEMYWAHLIISHPERDGSHKLRLFQKYKNGNYGFDKGEFRLANKNEIKRAEKELENMNKEIILQVKTAQMAVRNKYF